MRASVHRKWASAKNSGLEGLMPRVMRKAQGGLASNLPREKLVTLPLSSKIDATKDSETSRRADSRGAREIVEDVWVF